LAAAPGANDQGSLDEQVAHALAEARRRIEARAAGRHVAVLAVTKGFGPDEVRAAVAAGADGCGENYAQELVGKAEALGDVQPVWHFIGRLQRNKVRHIAHLVSVWQSVDRLSLGAEIARRAPGARVMVQCNISGEEAKGGCRLADAPGLVTDLTNMGLEVIGLMGVAADAPADIVRPSFQQLVALADDLGLAERSIGMSGDYEMAVEVGATVVRLGTVLFGRRGPGGTEGALGVELPEGHDSVGQ
jgi:hypothetical protein